jgi:hypothetical protein
MTENFTRWYDKDEKLKVIVQFIELLDDEKKEEIANDLIQLILEYKKTTADKMIETLNKNYVEVRKRWYDRSENLHFAIEMLKNSDDFEKQVIIRELMYSLLYTKDVNFKGNNVK